MLTAEELKSRLSVDMTKELMEYLGAEIYQENEKYCIYTSICHGNPDSRKLYYYKDTNSFYCWSQCGSLDIISIVQEIEELDFQNAIQFIIDFFQLEKKSGFGKPQKIEHKPREIKKKEINLDEKLPIYQESILNTFVDYAPLEWIKEGMSINAMKKFGIKYDLNTKSIIIPHRDLEGNLIGIRQRNLLKENIERYGKYTPYIDNLSSIMYNHKLSLNLYGLYENKKNIIKSKKVIIFESEKSVLLMNSYYPNNSIAIAVGGSVIHEFQLNLLKQLGVEEIAICFDYEIREKLLQKMDKSYKRCALYFKTYIMNKELMSKLLEESDSPIDKGKEVFEELLWNKKEYKITEV